MRRIIRNQIEPFDLGCDKFAEHGVILIYVQFAAVPVDKCTGKRCPKCGGLDSIVALHIIQNFESQTATMGRTSIVKIKYFGNFMGRPRAPI